MTTPQSSGHAPVNGIYMYYEIHGDGGLPLVLIHGGGSTIQTSFSRLIPVLAVHRQVIAVELQAHGRTTDRDAPELFTTDADDVAALLRYLNVLKADVLGFSNGGTTTMQLAIRHADLVNRIIVLSANYKIEGMMDGFSEGMKGATIESMPEPLKKAFLEVTPDQGKLQTMFEKDRDRMINFPDMSDKDLQNIQAPALLINTDRDVVTTEHTIKMSRLIPNNRVLIMPGTHGSIIGEAGSTVPSKTIDITASLIESFLDGEME